MATLVQSTPDVRYSPLVASPLGATEPHWTLATRIAFRFCVVYFGLYVLTTQMLGGMIPIPGLGIPRLQLLPPLKNVVLWVGMHLVGITTPISMQVTGSGDKMFDWLHALTLLGVAAMATIVWSIAARQRTSHTKVFAWFRLFLRFAVATTFVSYGLAKVVPLQMPTLALTKLVEPFGNFSPMGVLWYSIGASPAYEIFVGMAEVCAAVLLFIPMTAQLGAMMGIMNSIAIFTLNMTYDVPVKLFSFHLILMSAFLAAPNARRLFDLFVLHRVSSIREEPPVGRSDRSRRGVLIAQLVLAVYVLTMGGYGSARSWKQFGAGAPKSALYGIWDVEQMTVDGEVRPALISDTTRWRRAIFQRPTGMSFQRPNDTFKPYGASIDTTAKTLTLTATDSNATKQPLTFERPSRDRLILDGTMDGHSIHMELTFRDPDSFLQRSRGFHWISEVPFNR